MADVPSGVICMWPGTHASIPSGWSRNNTLSERYSRGTANATNPGNNGGSNTHNHSSNSHSHGGGSHSHTGNTGSNNDTGNFFQNNFVGAADTHDHGYTSGAIGFPTSGSGTTTWGSTNQDPAFFKVIYIQSDGTPTGFPDTSVVYFDSGTPPTDWIQHVGSKDRFMQGADGNTGNGGGKGGGAHSHNESGNHSHNFGNHDHPSSNTNSNNQNINITHDGPESNPQRAGGPHTHSISFATGQGSGVANGAAGSPQNNSYEPPFHTLLAIENDLGANSLPRLAIAMWLGTLASIPGAWILCDGTGVTPDLRDKYIKCANLGGDVGTTGGTSGHGHSTNTHGHSAGHTHGHNGLGGQNGGPLGGPSGNHLTGNHGHPSGTTASAGSLASATSNVSNTSNSEPQFRNVAYLQYTPSSLSNGMILGAD